VKIFSTHDGAGCGYYRVVVPLTELSKHGHSVTLLDQKERVPRADDYLEGGWDLVVGQRLSNYDGMMLWRKTRLRGSKIVYELDDDIWNVTQENFMAYTVYQDAALREAVKGYMEISDLVTTTTPYLAEVFSEWNPDVEVLPNCIPGWVLDLPRMNEGEPPGGRRPRIGWVGGASHGRDIHAASPAVRRFMKRNPGWDLYLGGSDYRSAFKVPFNRTIYAPWKQVNHDPAGFYSSYDFEIGICPLLATRFARSKSAVKALEMTARGIPVVATDIEAYQGFITHGVNGFLAKTDHEWLRYLNELANDGSLRYRMAQDARRMAGAYTIENRWEDWARAYGKLLA
jgi:glycosyltransferase involved in cell wall biosynthesis